VTAVKFNPSLAYRLDPEWQKIVADEARRR
jgi:hypothetical protein